MESGSAISLKAMPGAVKATSTSGTSLSRHRTLPVTIIEPRQSWLGLGLGELWRSRELLFYLCWRDVKIRYKQTFLGVAWAILQPALLMVVFSLFFGRLSQSEASPVPFPLFICAGILPWTFFATALSNAANSVVSSERMISKIYFPRLLLPLSSVGAALVDFLIAIVLMGAMLIWYGVMPAATIVLVPVLILLIGMTAAGLGIFLAALNVNYRDFRYIIPFLIQIGLFATPTIYLAPDLLGGKMQNLLWLNPMAAIIASFRAAIFGTEIPWLQLAGATVLSAGMLVLGMMYFRRVEGTFADHI